MNKKRILKLVIMVLVATMLPVQSVDAAEINWTSNNGTWTAYDMSGEQVKGWYKDQNNCWYFLDLTTGVMKTSWVASGSDWYYLNPANGIMQTGWQKINDHWYYMQTLGDKAGAILTGSQFIDELDMLLTFDDNGCLKNVSRNIDQELLFTIAEETTDSEGIYRLINYDSVYGTSKNEVAMYIVINDVIEKLLCGVTYEISFDKNLWYNDGNIYYADSEVQYKEPYYKELLPYINKEKTENQGKIIIRYSLSEPLPTSLNQEINNWKKKTKKAMDWIEEIAASARKYTNIVDQIRYVHDELIYHIDYNLDFINEKRAVRRMGTNEILIYASEGKAICEGYAIAFKAVMDQLNVPCSYIHNERHAWNEVKVDDQWYIVDVTFDDPIGGKLRYDYFLAGEEKIVNDATFKDPSGRIHALSYSKK